MHAALSVIFFTVVSGAGFGLLSVFLVMQSAGAVAALSINEELLVIGVATALIVAGLFSSSLHLANPRNAWRAVLRIRTSWLSREAVAAIACLSLIAFYGYAVFTLTAERPAWLMALGLAIALLAQITVFTTSMIYVSLKTIRNWNNPLVLANYHLLSLASGSVLYVFLLEKLAPETFDPGGFAPLALLAALLGKVLYFVWIDQRRHVGASIQTATGLPGGEVRLLDLGHTADNFTVREFGARVGRQLRMLARLAVYTGLVLGAVLAWPHGRFGAAQFSTLAVIVTFISIFVERWLFFVEARHAVMVYHGLGPSQQWPDE